MVSIRVQGVEMLKVNKKNVVTYTYSCPFCPSSLVLTKN